MTSTVERNQDATVYVGGLDIQVNESLLWELFLQAVNVFMPKDRVTTDHQGYGFVEFQSEEDADYAMKVMNMVRLFGKPVKVNKASQFKRDQSIGANLFIGNLASEVDEKLLYDTFSAFGVILSHPKMMRDPETGSSKGFAFINYASFEAADGAIEAMNGQYLCNRPISVTYALKKDGRGERHGNQAERLMAAQNPLIANERPHQLFSDAPMGAPVPTPVAAPMMFQPPPPPPGFQPGFQPGMPPQFPPPGGNMPQFGGFRPPFPPPGGAFQQPPQGGPGFIPPGFGAPQGFGAQFPPPFPPQGQQFQQFPPPPGMFAQPPPPRPMF